MKGGGFREFYTTLAHRPLRDDNGQAFLFTLGLERDATIEKLNQGVHGRMCTDADETFLPAIGADRGVLRGLTESSGNYRVRLQRAPADWQRAGNPWAVLSQTLGYVLSITPRAFTVASTWLGNTCKSSTWNEYPTGRSPTSEPQYARYNTAGAGNWDWDSVSPSSGSWGWWRWYMVIEASDAPGHGWITKDGTWGSGGAWGDGKAWGVDATSLVGKSLRIIARDWGSGVCHWIIISFDGALFDRAQPAGGGVNPDGRFGRWAKVSGGVYTRARFGDACYFEGPR